MPWQILFVYSAFEFSSFDTNSKPLRFLIEGLPTCVFAALAWFGLPDSIAQAKFLSEREKQIAFHFTARNQRIDVDRNQGLRFKEVLEGIKEPKSWILGMMYFSW